MGKMLMATTESVPGFEVVQVIGLVRGNTVRARHLGRDLMAGIRNLVGGEISDYTQLLTDAREEALERMIEQAEALEADAVIGIRFETGSVMDMASEIFVYGTAVRLRPIRPDQT